MTHLDCIVRTWFAAVALGAVAAAQEPAPSVPDLDAALQHFARSAEVSFAGLSVGHDGRLLHRSTVELDPDRAVPIASASKWLAVATILTLVDDGTLDLDLPLRRWLPEFDRPDKRGITLRQCLSCTAGFQPRLPAVRDRDLDMAGMARALAEHPLRSDPGLAFTYGGATFQAAACAAVRAADRDWHTLFRERIAAPLGLQGTAFGRLTPFGDEAGTASVPWVAGGAVSSLRDYERFARMLANGGELDGVRVLRAETVARMFESHTEGMKVRAPGFDEDFAYGLGTWLQPLDGAGDGGAVRAMDPGALGFTPWVEPDRGTCGVLAVQDHLQRVLPEAMELVTAVREYCAGPAVTGSDEYVQLAHGGRTRRYLLHAPPGAERARALPLVVVLHGGGGNGEQVARSTGFRALADRENFVAVFPDGTGALPRKLLTWNSGGIAVYASEHDVDDVGFLKAVVASVKTRVAIDPDRVYATGMSNGGMMCHRLAREAGDTFCAVAPVAGAMNFAAVEPQGPIAVMLVHGTDDDMVPYEGGRPRRRFGRANRRTDASVQDAIDYYRARLGLDGAPEVEVDGARRTETWRRADQHPQAVLRVVTIDGGGHVWPGSTRAPGEWSATEAVWEFFADVRRGPR
ncbi:MAG: serine hydrolase [Planctomycetota bacterium]